MHAMLRTTVLAVSFWLHATAIGAGAPRATWPTRNQYHRAMQAGERHLRDPKLRGARVVRDRHGYPFAFSGSFGSVFKVETSSGRPIAVRVFHPADGRDPHQLQQRYVALGQYLEQLAARSRVPPEIVEFAFVPDGIEIDGQALPILKLPWIEGRTLDSWITQRLSQGRQRALLTLADNFRCAVRDLQSVDLAHGDLHHGNIILEPSGRMRFIDYDALFAPPLAALANFEIGHPNFQHPRYHHPQPRPRPYDRQIDDFPALVIYLSLVAVGREPGLWQRFHRDHNLIFEIGDFIDPGRSPLFDDLARASDPIVRRLGHGLKTACGAAPRDTPSLERALKDARANQRWWTSNP